MEKFEKKIKIALIHPDYKNKVYETLSAPLGLCWISACLKKSDKFIVDCYDFAKAEELQSLFKSQDYEIICVQLHSQETLDENLLFISQIKYSNPKVLLVVGGIASDLNADYIIKKDYIDIVCLGEGEETVYDICFAIQRNIDFGKIKGIMYKNKISEVVVTEKREINYDLDNLPLPDREAFGLDYPQWSIITARGCPFNCLFCSVPQICENKVRYRDIKKVYEEICYLHDKYGMRKFFMLDDTFTVNRKRTIELCSLMKQDNRDIQWTCVTRADTVDRDMLQFMKNAGCIQISCGIESANDDIQKIINKNLNINNALHNLKIAKEVGLRVRCSFIFGLPGEEEKHILQSIKFMCDLMPNEVQIYPYVPYKGTGIYENANSYGLNLNSYKFWDKKNLFTPYIETNLLNGDDIKRLSQLCIVELKNRGYLWIPGDIPTKKHALNYVVMTEFAPVQTLC